MADAPRQNRIVVAAVEMQICLEGVSPILWGCADPLVHGTIALGLGVPLKSRKKL
jgi:hypothetical protein